MQKIAPLFTKNEVIACLGIKACQFKDFANRGIIPMPAGREGNGHRWNSNTIKAISASLLVNGSDYTKQHTLDILMKEVIAFEAR